MTANPADAVREALPFDCQRFSVRPIGGLVQPEITGEGAWVLYADHARVIAALTARVNRLEKMLYDQTSPHDWPALNAAIDAAMQEPQPK